MKRVDHLSPRREDLLHVEAIGCIINVRIGLRDPEGHDVTSVEVIPDSDWTRDGQGNVRVISKHTMVKKYGESKLPTMIELTKMKINEILTGLAEAPCFKGTKVKVWLDDGPQNLPKELTVSLKWRAKLVKTPEYQDPEMAAGFYHGTIANFVRQEMTKLLTLDGRKIGYTAGYGGHRDDNILVKFPSSNDMGGSWKFDKELSPSKAKGLITMMPIDITKAEMSLDEWAKHLGELFKKFADLPLFNPKKHNLPWVML